MTTFPDGAICKIYSFDDRTTWPEELAQAFTDLTPKFLQQNNVTELLGDWLVIVGIITENPDAAWYDRVQDTAYTVASNLHDEQEFGTFRWGNLNCSLWLW